MSLRQCHECGHEVSSSATRCPNCGANVQTTGSKILVGVIFLIGAIITIYICYYIWYNSETQQFKRFKLPEHYGALPNAAVCDSNTSHLFEIVGDYSMVS